MKNSPAQVLIFIVVLTVISFFVAVPPELTIAGSWFNQPFTKTLKFPKPEFFFLGKHIKSDFPFKQGLDIQGGMQMVLETDMTEIEEVDRLPALEAVRGIISRRVDLFGISEPVIQTTQVNNQYRIIIELPGVSDFNQALNLVGQTAKLDFRLLSPVSTASAVATTSATSTASGSGESVTFDTFSATGLSGRQLKRSAVQFDQQSGKPVIGLEFAEEGRQLFAAITTAHVGEILAIFLDDMPIATPVISTPIVDGRAVMSGSFTVASAKQLAIQLNAGALPVPVKVLEQRAIGASLGEASIQKSMRAGLIGLVLICLFMILLYGLRGVVATLALVVYAIITIALYKIMGVTLTIPGIAGLLLSIGMAVDANILIFERMKEELRAGETVARALELGFGRAWDSIRDANVATIITSLILINPLDFPFLNSSGLVRGFGITLLLGVLIGLFTGIVVSRTLLRLSLPWLGHKS